MLPAVSTGHFNSSLVRIDEVDVLTGAVQSYTRDGCGVLIYDGGLISTWREGGGREEGGGS